MTPPTPRMLTSVTLMLAAAVAGVSVALVCATVGAERTLAPVSAYRAAAQARRAGSTAAGWHGGPVTTSGGETVTVLVSDAYSGPENAPERWADFLVGLVHGKEISSVVLYVAPLDELQEICGEHALGCYGFGRMYVLGDPVSGITPEMVATHEYGHHVAMNRLNSPWAAIDWGTKRWATHQRICQRQAAGEVHPGDEDAYYTLNPGEGFVEAYRVLNEVRDGAATFSWDLVDNLFYPDGQALTLVEEDVLEPWAAPTTSTIRARFTETGRRVWSRVVDLPLDGSLEITAAMPLASGFNVTLRTVDGSRVLARARWTSGAPTRTLSFLSCGMRGAELRLVRTGGPGVVTMRVAIP